MENGPLPARRKKKKTKMASSLPGERQEQGNRTSPFPGKGRIGRRGDSTLHGKRVGVMGWRMDTVFGNATGWKGSLQPAGNARNLGGALAKGDNKNPDGSYTLWDKLEK